MKITDLTRPIIGIENRTVQEVFDIMCDRITAALSAAPAVVERMLPGWGWALESNTEHIKNCLNPEYGSPIGKYPHWASVSNISTRKYEDGRTPAIALLLAIFRALDVKQTLA